MSVEKIYKCDRCGKPFSFSLMKWAGYFTHGIKKENKLRFHSMFAGNLDGYSYMDYRYDLCVDCTEKLIVFLENKDKE